jgi:hypothetical protein
VAARQRDPLPITHPTPDGGQHQGPPQPARRAGHYFHAATFRPALLTAPLEFTRYLQQMQDYVIGAISKPLPATDPVAAYRYNESRARTLQNAFRQRPLLRMQDKNLEQLAIIGGERSVRFEEIATDTGEAGIVIRGGSDLGDFVRNAVRIEEDLHLSIDVNPSGQAGRPAGAGRSPRSTSNATPRVSTLSS